MSFCLSTICSWKISNYYSVCTLQSNIYIPTCLNGRLTMPLSGVWYKRCISEDTESDCNICMSIHRSFTSRVLERLRVLVQAGCRFAYRLLLHGFVPPVLFAYSSATCPIQGIFCDTLSMGHFLYLEDEWCMKGGLKMPCIVLRGWSYGYPNCKEVAPTSYWYSFTSDFSSHHHFSSHRSRFIS